jgi:ribose 5-phosphate isomerase B
MTIYLGADHAGFALKEKIKEWLQGEGHAVQDLGAYTLDPLDDYPDFAAAVAQEVAQNPKSRGILFCGSAEGVCIAANKIAGIRAVSPTNVEGARLSRIDDDANILCLPGGQMKIPVPELAFSLEKAKKLITLWLLTPFSGEERHVRRLRKIEELETRK